MENPSGGGIVEYATAREAKNAMAELNDTDLNGRMIFVREDRVCFVVCGFAFCVCDNKNKITFGISLTVKPIAP